MVIIAEDVVEGIVNTTSADRLRLGMATRAVLQHPVIAPERANADRRLLRIVTQIAIRRNVNPSHLVSVGYYMAQGPQAQNKVQWLVAEAQSRHDKVPT